jgi:hypothetical protein
MLNKLCSAGENGKTIKIRIGGDEHIFDGNIDVVSSVSIDDKLYFDYSLQDQNDFRSIRNSAINKPLIIPVPANLPIVNAVVNTVINTAVDVDANDLRDAISLIVNDKVDQGQMFTAFDITKEIRANGTQARHKDIKEIVHELYINGDMGGYIRSLINIANVTIQPFIYHPNGSDISTYKA